MTIGLVNYRFRITYDADHVIMDNGDVNKTGVRSRQSVEENVASGSVYGEAFARCYFDQRYKNRNAEIELLGTHPIDRMLNDTWGDQQ